jgi:uncharacterized damage-inducible protein DinB
MIDARYLRMLVRYRAWADRLTFDAVAALPAGEAAKERPTLFKSLIGTLNHTYLIDLVWQAHLEGRDHGLEARNLVLHPDLSDLREAQQKITQWYLSWSDAQSDEDFDEIVRFAFISGKPGAMTRGEILLHVVNHATYHRGWIADLFFQIPAKNPSTDLPDYLGEMFPR